MINKTTISEIENGRFTGAFYIFEYVLDAVGLMSILHSFFLLINKNTFHFLIIKQLMFVSSTYLQPHVDFSLLYRHEGLLMFTLSTYHECHVDFLVFYKHELMESKRTV